jgi:hypothetical protein
MGYIETDHHNHHNGSPHERREMRGTMGNQKTRMSLCSSGLLESHPFRPRQQASVDPMATRFRPESGSTSPEFRQRRLEPSAYANRRDPQRETPVSSSPAPSSQRRGVNP